MEIYLNKDTSFDKLNVEEYQRRDGRAIKVGKIQLEQPSPVVPPNPRAQGVIMRLCNKLLQMDTDCGYRPYLCIHLIESAVSVGLASFNKLTVRAHGCLCDILQDVDKEKFKLKLQIGIHSARDQTHSTCNLKLLSEDIPLSVNTAREPFEDITCIQNSKYIQGTTENGCMKFLSEYSDINGSINLILSENEILDGRPDELFRGICKKILDNRIHTDVIIVASDGQEFACNRNFLAANSPVFAAMFETHMAEAETKKVAIDDMDGNAVGAMLTYIYGRDLKAPLENSTMAFELFKAGHKYDISHLENDIRDICLRKPATWYAAEVALELLLFVRKLIGFDDLKAKALDVLKIKSDKMTFREFKEQVGGSTQLKEFDLELLFDVLQISSLKTGSNDDLGIDSD